MKALKKAAQEYQQTAYERAKERNRAALAVAKKRQRAAYEKAKGRMKQLRAAQKEQRIKREAAERAERDAQLLRRSSSSPRPIDMAASGAAKPDTRGLANGSAAATAHKRPHSRRDGAR